MAEFDHTRNGQLCAQAGTNKAPKKTANISCVSKENVFFSLTLRKRFASSIQQTIEKLQIMKISKSVVFHHVLSAAALLLAVVVFTGSANAALIGYWKMNDAPGSAIAFDSSGNGNDGTADSGITTFNGSYGQFTGPSNLVRLPVGVGSTQTSFTWAAVIQTTGVGDWNSVISEGTGWNPGSIAFRVDSTGCAGFLKHGTAGVQGTTVVNDNQWHRIAVTWELTTKELTFYTDGNQEAQTSSNLDAFPSEGGPLVGLMNGIAWSDMNAKELRIYDNALTASEVAAIPLPEPATWVLLAFSLCTVIFLRRRRAA